ncbi:MAG: nitrous oxide reductase family maturation protein NosD [Chromatocurvus sp.]
MPIFRINRLRWLMATLPTPPVGGDATLFVDTATGDDSVPYAENSASTPWQTIGRAAWGSANPDTPNAGQAAQAGDIVQVAAGIYWETGSASRETPKFMPTLTPVNSGVAGSPIIFRGVGNVYLRMVYGIRGPMLGSSSNRNYIIWDNFQVDDYYGGSTSDTGPVAFSGCSYCQIINSNVQGHPGTYYHGYDIFGGNYRGISLEPDADHNIIRNNRIHGFAGGQNEAGIMAYDSNYNLIENNDLYGNGQAIFIKGIHPDKTQVGNIIRLNLIHDNVGGVRILGSVDARVYKNVVINNTGTGIHLGFSPAEGTRAYNNTLYGNATGIHAQGDELLACLVRNNIVVDCGDQAIFDWQVNNPSLQDVAYDRNLYFGNTRHAFYEGGAGEITFAAWQATYGHDLNGLVADPLFVNAAAGDFRLQAGSPALTLGRDTFDLDGDSDTAETIPAGAYVTGDEIIGLLT